MNQISSIPPYAVAVLILVVIICNRLLYPSNPSLIDFTNYAAFSAIFVGVIVLLWSLVLWLWQIMYGGSISGKAYLCVIFCIINIAVEL